MEREMAPGVWNLTPEDAGCYLIVGGERALMLDTGFGHEDVRAMAERLTDRPLILANTHYHGDHTGCNDRFDRVYAHPLEHDRLRDTGPTPVPVEEGDVLDLGGRRLEVLHTPGHTPGSISLLDRENRQIFTGDLLSAGGPIYMQNDDCDLDAYVATLSRLEEMRGLFDQIFVCHGPSPLDISWAEKLKACVAAYRRGETRAEPVHIGPPGGGATVNCHRWNGAAILRRD